MPSGAMPLIELLLYLLRNIFLHIVLLKGLINPQKAKALRHNTASINKPRNRIQKGEPRNKEKEERKVVKTNGDGDINGLLLHVGDHIGALDDDLLRGNGRCR